MHSHRWDWQRVGIHRYRWRCVDCGAWHCDECDPSRPTEGRDK